MPAHSEPEIHARGSRTAALGDPAPAVTVPPAGGMQPWQALLQGGSARLNGMVDTGLPVIVTYAFAEAADLDPRSAPADAALAAAMRHAVSEAEAVAGVRFVAVDPEAEPMVTLAFNTDGSGWSWADFPRTSAAAPGTAVAILMTDVLESYAPGSLGFEILLHELGHALGLKHPHDGTPRLDRGLDDDDHTLMSYARGGDPKDGFRPLDVAALRHLYGPPDSLDGVVTVYRAASDVLVVKGTAEADALLGVNGVTLLSGAAGDDLLIGREAGDGLRGGAGADTLTGFAGDDALFGGTGDDVMEGGRGADRIAGGRGADHAAGGTGADVLSGAAGRDTLIGGRGDDTLAGGRGDDLLVGGAGADVIVAARRGDDTVLGFTPGEGDRIDVSALAMAPDEAAAHLSVARVGLVFETGEGSIVLPGVTLSDADWLFVA